MRGPGRQEKAAAQLLKTARARIEELQSHLADIESAKASAEASLNWLEEARRAEATSHFPDTTATAELRRFVEGADEKREALKSTYDTLAAESLSVQQFLRDANVEIAKLETLIEVSRRTAPRRSPPAPTTREIRTVRASGQ